MLNSSYKGRYVSRFPSPVDAPSARVSVDVCKVPAPPAPFVPVPYPTTAWGTAAANKQAASQELKRKLQTLHTKITALCGGDATQVHKVLDDYADTVSKLHATMAPAEVAVRKIPG